jgi:hypothetical protein
MWVDKITNANVIPCINILTNIKFTMQHPAQYFNYQYGMKRLW